MIAVLLLHRSMPAAAVAAGIIAALDGDRIDADLVTVEARRHLEIIPATQLTTTAGATTAGATTLAAVEVLGAARPPGGTRAGYGGEDTRPAPSLTGYDELLAAGGAR